VGGGAELKLPITIRLGVYFSTMTAFGRHNYFPQFETLKLREIIRQDTLFV
jgi:hypothetical protein